MKDKLNTIKTAVCAVLAVGCAALAFLFWDASDRASSLLEENDTLRGQITALQREADTAAASAETMQQQVDAMTAQIEELNGKLERAAPDGLRDALRLEIP